jgi:hypothetical protein
VLLTVEIDRFAGTYYDVLDRYDDDNIDVIKAKERVREFVEIVKDACSEAETSFENMAKISILCQSLGKEMAWFERDTKARS